MRHQEGHAELQSTGIREVTLPPAISEYGKGIVRRFIGDYVPGGMGMHGYEPPDGWALVTDSGKLAKRIRNDLFKQYGVRLGDSTVSELGNKIRQYSSGEGKYYVDITRTFGWRRGDFNDPDSCYFTTNCGAMDMIAEGEGIALRFWDDKSRRNSSEGIGEYESRKMYGAGRAWALPTKSGHWTVFNCYHDNLSLFEAASILAQIASEEVGKPYLVSEVECANHGDVGGRLYINQGKGMYLHWADEDAPGRVNYKIDDIYGEPEDGEVCCECGEFLCPEMGEVYVYEHDYHNVWCEDCFYERFGYCSCCEQDMPREELREGYWTNRWEKGVQHGELCEYCWEEHNAECEVCGEAVWIEETVEVECDYLCEKCARDNARECEGCKEYFYDDNLKEYEGEELCDYCMRKHKGWADADDIEEVQPCVKCGRDTHEDQGVTDICTGERTCYTCTWDVTVPVTIDMSKVLHAPGEEQLCLNLQAA